MVGLLLLLGFPPLGGLVFHVRFFLLQLELLTQNSKMKPGGGAKFNPSVSKPPPFSLSEHAHPMARPFRGAPFQNPKIGRESVVCTCRVVTPPACTCASTLPPTFQRC
jgi:hypothetical protein